MIAGYGLKEEAFFDQVSYFHRLGLWLNNWRISIIHDNVQIRGKLCIFPLKMEQIKENFIAQTNPFPPKPCSRNTSHKKIISSAEIN